MKYLFIGAHPDDIELFCGGTVLRLLDEGHEAHFLVATNGGGKDGDRKKEMESAAKIFGVELSLLELQDRGLRHGRALVNLIDACFEAYRPDVVFTHWKGDYHQDHEALAKSTIAANRNRSASLIQYLDHMDNFEINLFVDITNHFEKKMEILSKYKSQKDEWYMQGALIETRSTGTNIAKHVEKFRVQFLRV